MVSRALCFILALTFGGCSEQAKNQAKQNPDANPVRRAPTQPETADSRPVIAAFGDSLTAGFGAEPGKSYPDLLQKLLDSNGYHYRVFNAGVSGDTTTDGVQRVGAVAELHPSVAIVELGGNDGLRGLPVAATEANLESIVRTFQDAGTKPLLAGITLPRNYGPAYIKSFDEMYPRVAKRLHVPLVPFLLAGVAGPGLPPTLMQPDGIHATAAGNQIVAGTVFRYLKPMLQK